MVKSRKSKAKHQDFQKVKLKVGKKLPKGLNETRATFKTRAIIVKNQLKGESSQPVTKRKLNIHDLLTQCQHYSVSVKQDALTGLKELTSSNPTLLHQHLPVLLERLAALTVDKEPLVRQAILRLFKEVFDQVSEDQLSPFFPMINAYLTSAMTHIQDDIKRDSLNMLDMLLERYPALVTSKSNQLLNHFVDQISQRGHNKSKGEASRMLVVNPSSKTSTMRWRRGVLRRLHKVLLALLSSRQQSGGKGKSQIDMQVDEARECSYQPFPVVNQKGIFHFRLSTSSQSSAGSLLQNATDLQSFMQTLVPLLIECWVEVTASDNAQDFSDGFLDTEAMLTLQSIVEVVQMLIQCSQLMEDSEMLLNWFQQQYLADLTQYFMRSFPWSCDGSAGATSKKAKHRKKQEHPKVAEDQGSAVTLNLGICDVLTSLSPALDNSVVPWMTRVVHYCNSTLHIERLNHVQLMTVLSVAERVLKATAMTEATNKLLTGLQKTFHSKLRNQKEMSSFVSFLEKVVTDEHYVHLQQNTALDKWIESLMSVVINTEGKNCVQIVKLIRRIASRGHSALLEALQRQFPSVMSKGDHWIDLVYYVPDLNKEVFTLMAEGALSQHHRKPERCSYLIDILKHRYLEHTIMKSSSMITKRSVKPEAYISFLLTLILGQTKSMQGLSPDTDSTQYAVFDHTKVCYRHAHLKYIVKHQEICKHCSQGLQGMLSHKEVLNPTKTFLSCYMESHSAFELRQAWGCILLCSSILPKLTLVDAKQIMAAMTKLFICLHHITRLLTDQDLATPGQSDKESIQEVSTLILQDLATTAKAHPPLVRCLISDICSDIHDWEVSGRIEEALDLILWLLQTTDLKHSKEQLTDFHNKSQVAMEGKQMQKWAEFIYMLKQL